MIFDRRSHLLEAVLLGVFLLAGGGSLFGDEPPRHVSDPTGNDVIASGPYPSLYRDGSLFRQAIERATNEPLNVRVTGLILPHHLLVAHLIARGVRLAMNGRYDRIVILTPDHFWRSHAEVSVPDRDFETCLGPVSIDRKAIGKILGGRGVAVDSLSSHEHGIQAILPFIAHFFPGVPVVPVILRPNARNPFWKDSRDLLKPLISSDTLVIQSTDFSHFLDWREAARHDQESLHVLALREPERVFSLRQPAHVDSLAAMYQQMCIQRDCFSALPFVEANFNSHDFFPEVQEKTTSYMVVVFSPQPVDFTASDSYTFLGDTFFGRGVARLMQVRRETLQGKLLAVRGAGRVILNLEGVVLAETPAASGGASPAASPRASAAERTAATGPGPSPQQADACGMGVRNARKRLGMPRASTLEMLGRLGVKDVSVANNHSADFGPEPRREMLAMLASAGIRVMDQGSVTDFGPFRLAVFTDIDNSRMIFEGALADADLESLKGVPRDKPLFVFIHWGREWSLSPGSRENHLVDLLRSAGVKLVIGAHSHTTGSVSGDSRMIVFHSLGNFLFDQLRPPVAGGALDVKFFRQGTWFPASRAIGNLYDLEGTPPDRSTCR